MRKSRILGPQILLKSAKNASEIDVPTNMKIFTDFYMIFVACCKSQHQKNVRPRTVLLTFHTIRLIALSMHFWSEKPTKNPSKMTSEPLQNRYQKRVVFQHRFFELSASILEPTCLHLGPQVETKNFQSPQASF